MPTPFRDVFVGTGLRDSFGLVIIKDASRCFKAELLSLIQQLRKSKQNNQRNDLSKACFCPKKSLRRNPQAFSKLLPSYLVFHPKLEWGRAYLHPQFAKMRQRAA